MEFKLKKSVILLTFIMVSSISHAQFELKLNLNLPGGEVLLAHYYGASILADDTIRLDGSGSGVLKRDTLLPQGIYKIFLNQEKHFDFLLGEDQQLTITNSDFTIDNMTIEGAVESIEFLDYMHWIRRHQERRKNLETHRAETEDQDKHLIDDELRQLNKEVLRYWMDKSEEYPGSFLGVFLMSNYFPELKKEDIPAEIAEKDSLRWLYHYNYNKTNFFKYYDLTDERLLYTPSIKQKLETYFERILLQVYDSVKPAAYQIIKQVEPHPEMFRFVVAHLLNSSLNSKIMGMDALFVDIARDYYLSGKASWADQTTLDKIRENVIFLENNLLGKNARDFQMETVDGNPFRLYQQNAKYTILVFYEPNCSHCREYIPKLYDEVYLPYRDMGLDVVAVFTMEKKPEWEEFIRNHHLTGWHNVWDEHHISRFKIIYDTRTTPAVYLLDKDKKIIAKKFTIDFLKEYFRRNLS